jgi:hypothetical protein
MTRTLALTLFLVTLLPLYAQTRAHDPAEQTTFSAEEDVRHTVTLPESVLQTLQHDSSVESVLRSDNLRPGQLPRTWFSAAEVHLRNGAHTDFVVQATGELMGANVTTFWIFIATPSGPQLALTIPAHDLALQPRRFHGYKLIEASAEDCCTIRSARYRFDGSQYVKFSSSTSKIR